ncbi:MAG: DUF4199 domain-containing protein [Novosphingobium sp.]|nr:DUF4199 domain-containing protein [Novosphingobium sp.]
MNWTRYALIYGALSGAVVAGVIVAGMVFKDQLGFTHSELFGYLAMLASLTFLFVGVKRYRDIECGGTIKFLPALGMGLAIALVATLAYATVWEIYLAVSGTNFIEDYIASVTAKLHAKGASPAEMAKHQQEFEWMRAVYRDPVQRFAMTCMEILPVSIIVAVVSAVALRFPKFLPARV